MAISKRRKPRKDIRDQTIVITGATSGIGLATALLASERGARLVVASRNEPELKNLVEEIHRRGGEATYRVADVSNLDDVRGIAETAVRDFGGIDIWINNAGTSIFGRLMETPLE